MRPFGSFRKRGFSGHLRPSRKKQGEISSKETRDFHVLRQEEPTNTVSQHIQSPETEAELRRQRRMATTMSMVIAVLSVTLIGLILAFIILPSLSQKSATLVTYQAAMPADVRLDQKRMDTQVQRKPSAPSSAMAKVIASTSPAPISVPVPEVTENPSLEFGSDGDFGSGWGSGDGTGAGGTSFFGQSVRAERICYVIDFSSSMGSQGRADLMRKELSKSIGQLSHGTSYGIVFFSCIAWEAGNQVSLNRNGGTAVVKVPGGKNYKWKKAGGRGWGPDGIGQRANWFTASAKQLADSRQIVKKAPLSSGTSWDKGIEMALDMSPPPQVICFMTDGVASGSDVWARQLGAKAKSRGVQINCIALMEPRAHKDLDELAKRTGGRFSVVDKNGKHKHVR